jgi:hypothetical protein
MQDTQNVHSFSNDFLHSTEFTNSDCLKKVHKSGKKQNNTKDISKKCQ